MFARGAALDEQLDAASGGLAPLLVCCYNAHIELEQRVKFVPGGSAPWAWMPRNRGDLTPPSLALGISQFKVPTALSKIENVEVRSIKDRNSAQLEI